MIQNLFGKRVQTYVYRKSKDVTKNKKISDTSDFYFESDMFL